MDRLAKKIATWRKGRDFILLNTNITPKQIDSLHPKKQELLFSNQNLLQAFKDGIITLEDFQNASFDYLSDVYLRTDLTPSNTPHNREYFERYEHRKLLN